MLEHRTLKSDNMDLSNISQGAINSLESTKRLRYGLDNGQYKTLREVGKIIGTEY